MLLLKLLCTTNNTKNHERKTNNSIEIKCKHITVSGSGKSPEVLLCG